MSRDPHQEALMAAAERLGIEALPMPAAFGPDAVVYRRRGRRALVLEGRVYPELSVVADRLCALKPAMKALLAEHGVPTPMGFAFTDAHAPEVVARAADGARRPFVVKPVEGTHGDGVGLGLTDHEALVAWVRRHALVRTGWLVEDFVAGADLRLQVLGGEVIAACTRVPAAVVGDGRRTLRALVAERAVEVAARNPLNALVVDGETGALLARQGLGVDDVPAAGREVVLKRLANMSQGARAVDVTERLHPRWRAYVGRIAEALGLGTFALDAVAVDPGADPDDGGASVLELNARAEWLHHTFSEGRTHDVPAMVLEHLLGAA